MEMIPEPEMWKTSQVCAVLKIDPRTLRRWADAGKLTVVRVGASQKHRRYFADEIRALLGTGPGTGQSLPGRPGETAGPRAG